MGGGSQELQRLSGWQNCLVGMAAGAGSKMCNYPLLVMKNNEQIGVPTNFNPRILYRGLPIAVVNMGGTTTVQFGCTGAFQKMLKTIVDDDTTVQMGGSLLGGLASGVPCSLWELVMVQQQQRGGTILGTPARILKDYGARGLMRGMTMTLGREGLFTLAMLGITPWIQTQLSTKAGMESNVALAAGALTGSVTAALISHPMDTIKTCQQEDLGAERYGSSRQSFALLRKEHGGMRGLYKGLKWRIALIGTTFFLVNSIKERLAPRMFPAEFAIPM